MDPSFLCFLSCRFNLQALPIYLDKIFHPFVAVVLSVTFVLAFGEVKYLSDSVCLHHTQGFKLDIALIVTMPLGHRLSHKLYAQDMDSMLVLILWGLYLSGLIDLEILPPSGSSTKKKQS